MAGRSKSKIDEKVEFIMPSTWRKVRNPSGIIVYESNKYTIIDGTPKALIVDGCVKAYFSSVEEAYNAALKISQESK